MTPTPTAPEPLPAPRRHAGPERPHDLVGVGIGPGNLSLAALAHGFPGGLDTVFFERAATFHSHPGRPVEGATARTPFLADLVTLADPTSPWTFLNYLRSRDRLLPFHAAGRLHMHRAEYDAYGRWVSDHLPGLHFRHQVDAVRWNPELDLFEVDHARLDPDGETEVLGRAYARNVALGVGSQPDVPEPLKPLVAAPTVPVLHSADYPAHREALLAAGHVTVVGSGQSGADVFLDLLRHRPPGREGMHWITRTDAFASAERSRLGLEHLTPDHARYFHELPEQARDALVPGGRRHGAVARDTLDAIHDELYRRTVQGGRPDAVLTPGVHVRTAGRLATTKVELHLEHVRQGSRTRLTTDAVVLATGYRDRPLRRLLAALDPYLRRDSRDRPRVDEHHRLVLDPSVTGSVYVVTSAAHTHGAGAADPGMTAWRSATVLNHLTGKEPYPLPGRTAFTSFGLERREQPRVPAPDRGLTPLGGRP
ncbi:lysine N(6)-hydroxylase/L-ornithine N(5)-oxygenase family protein [Streptomyces kanasensis]|uniref:lysine N(6)-hydroxylase/L-ornithine N(5)-oxygenase family protein n=1 Tax=Streptomyces kanasensis TaxID=936756 RepID=UPI0036F98D30